MGSGELELEEVFDTEEVAGERPLVLTSQNIPAEKILAVVVVRSYGDIKSQRELSESLARDGYQVLSVVIVRNDSINFGNNCCSAVQHEINTIMVKLKD